MPKESGPQGFKVDVIDDDYFKEIVGDLLDIAKDMKEASGSRDQEIDSTEDEWRLRPAAPSKTAQDTIKEKVGKMNPEQLSYVRQQLNKVLLDKNMARVMGAGKRQGLREALKWVNELMAENQKEQTREKTITEQARGILGAVLNSREYLAELFEGKDIFIHDLSKFGKGQDFGIQFNAKGEEEPKLLICKVRVTPEDLGKNNRIKWFKEKKDMTLENNLTRQKPLYINLVLQEENLAGLKISLAGGEIKNDLIDSVKNDLETQLAVILLDRIGEIMEKSMPGKYYLGQDIEEYFSKYEEEFKGKLTYDKIDFQAAVEELEDYLNDKFPEIKNDPIVNNAFSIMGRMKADKEQEDLTPAM